MQENKDVIYTKFGWIDLSNLVKRNQSYNWNASVGKTIDFEYQGIKATLMIKEKVSQQYVKVDVDGYIKDKIIYVGQIKHNRLGDCVNVITSRFKYNSGDIVNNIQVLECVHDKNGHKYYHCKCLIDGYEWDLREDHLKNGHGCPVCVNKVVMKGVNDIATTNPEYIKYFIDVNDAYIHTASSNKYIKFKCPYCGDIKKHRIADITERGFSCMACGDSVSYPNKYMYNFLKQLFDSKEIQLEHKFDWSKFVPVSWNSEGKLMRYDVYIPMFNMIIENHGAQHYDKTGFNSKEPLWKIQENDKAKRQVAIDNDIYYYIEIDCRNSESNYIKNSIMNSELPNIFGFNESDIDWDECDKYASGSLLIKASEYWNSGTYNIKEIANQFGLHPDTIRRYIKKARSLNLIES